MSRFNDGGFVKPGSVPLIGDGICRFPISDEMEGEAMSADDMIMNAADEVGKPHGMTGSEVLTAMVMAGRRHGDAADHECAEVSPFDESHWCHREPGHGGSHFPWPLDGTRRRHG